MPRYIIECKEPDDIILGMKCIKKIAASDVKEGIVSLNDGSLWYVKRTKTGFSARTGDP